MASSTKDRVEFKVDFHKSWGSIWRKGDALYGREADGTWMAVVCIEPRKLGSRGGIKGPAHSATIKARTWRGIRAGFHRIGFQPPVRHRA